jgi:hypothetical protein
MLVTLGGARLGLFCVEYGEGYAPLDDENLPFQQRMPLKEFVCECSLLSSQVSINLGDQHLVGAKAQRLHILDIDHASEFLYSSWLRRRTLFGSISTLTKYFLTFSLAQESHFVTFQKRFLIRRNSVSGLSCLH